MAGSLGASNFQLAYQISPIMLTNGIAPPGGMLPIISITDAEKFSGGLLNLTSDTELDDFFAQYMPLPGASLIDQDIGHYPFANQAVAANAVIQNPLKLSFRMICPVRDAGGFLRKRAVITSLKSSLDQHNQSGGTYTLATPAFIYAACLMTSFRDISSGASKQAQMEWQLDFEQPLLTEEQAAQSMNLLMNRISSGAKFSGPPAWSSIDNIDGQPQSLAAASLYPAAAGGAASNTAFPQNATVIPQ